MLLAENPALYWLVGIATHISHSLLYVTLQLNNTFAECLGRIVGSRVVASNSHSTDEAAWPFLKAVVNRNDMGEVPPALLNGFMEVSSSLHLVCLLCVLPTFVFRADVVLLTAHYAWFDCFQGLGVYGAEAFPEHRRSVSSLPTILPQVRFPVIDEVGFADQLTIAQLLSTDLGATVSDLFSSTISNQLLLDPPLARAGVNLSGPALAVLLEDLVAETNANAHDSADYVPLQTNTFDSIVNSKCAEAVARGLATYEQHPAAPVLASIRGGDNWASVTRAHDTAAAAAQAMFLERVGGLRSFPCFERRQQELSTLLADKLMAAKAKHDNCVKEISNFAAHKASAIHLADTIRVEFPTQHQQIRASLDRIVLAAATAAVVVGVIEIIDAARAQLARHPGLQLINDIAATYTTINHPAQFKQVSVAAVMGTRDVYRNEVRVRNVPAVKGTKKVCPVRGTFSSHLS